MSYTDNLSPKFIMDFTPEDTIYVQRITGSGSNKYSVTFLCSFKEYRGNKVFATAISTDTNPSLYAREIEQGLELSANLSSCALYGKNPITGHTSFHWFMPSGYAIYPHDYDKESGNANIVNEHPAFGLVRLSRRSSRGTVLFGSSINHNEVIALTISKGSVDRRLNQEWYHAKQELIEIELSANQFAELITTPNSGTGTPCTIRHFSGTSIPEPPYESTKDKYSSEFESTMKNIGSDLTAKMDILKNILDKPSTSKGDKVEIMNLFTGFVNSIQDTIPFIDKQFGEQMDKTITAAKAEIEAFITRRLTEEGKKVLLGEKGGAEILLDAPTRTEE